MLTTKELNLAIKNKKGYEELIKKHNYSCKEDLFEAIRKLSSSGCDYFIRELEKNQKNIAKRKKPKKAIFWEIPGKQISKEDEKNKIPEVEQKCSEELEVEENEEKNILNLEQLQNDESTLSEWICALEIENKEKATKRREIVVKLGEAKKSLEEIQSLLHEQEALVTFLCEEYNNYAREMEAINREKASYKELLADIRTQIEELRKVSILVFEDGSIEVGSVAIPTISEEELEKEFNNLIRRSEAEDLTIKEVKTISKLILIVNEYKNEQYTLEFTFDNVKLQKFFESIM